MTTLAIIGGSGFTGIEAFTQVNEHHIETPYGQPSGPILEGMLGNTQTAVFFLSRHGEQHQFPPHKINYRANLWALHSLGVKDVIALASVGGITPAFGPAVLAIPDQIIDYTWGREHTFFDDFTQGMVHVEMSYPYAARLRQALIAACEKTAYPFMPKGVYGVTQGPRLETAAEILRMGSDGCDLVGMTGMPEASLAVELELNYAHLAFVVNWAAGKSNVAVTLEEINKVHKVTDQRVYNVLVNLVSTIMPDQ